MLTPSLISVSIIILVVGFQIWRSTGSRAAIGNALFGSLALLAAARMVASRVRPDAAIGLTFFAAMLLLGRGLGTYLRLRRDSQWQLRQAAYMWFGAGVACGACAAATYLSVVNS